MEESNPEKIVLSRTLSAIDKHLRPVPAHRWDEADQDAVLDKLNTAFEELAVESDLMAVSVMLTIADLCVQIEAKHPTRPEERRQITHWVERGDLAVAVEVECVIRRGERLFEPPVVRLLDEVARRAAAGDVEYLQHAGTVYRKVPPAGDGSVQT